MKAVYRLLGITTTLAILASPALAIDDRGTIGMGQVPPGGSATGFICDEGAFDSAWIQNELNGYGNAFDVGAGGPLSTLSFWHFGWTTLVGPYNYNVRVYDEATCTEICTIEGLEAADAFDSDQLEEEDLCAADCSVSGSIVVAIEPLSCAVPTDCYPDVWFDQTGVINACGRIVDVVAGTGCDVPADTGAGGIDYVQSITVDECGGVPTVNETWTGVKSLFE